MNTISFFSKAGKNYNQIAPLFLRLAMGAGFIAHGYAKLQRGPAGFAKLLAFTHIPFPAVMAWVVSLTELIGGIALVLGLYVSIISIPLICTMLAAMVTVQFGFGFSSVNTIGLTAAGPKFGPPGYEINVLYIAGLLSLMFTGAGRFSFDGASGQSKRHL
jgi:putative oxidoreductase